MESSFVSWLIGGDSAGYKSAVRFSCHMLMNIAPTTTTLSCASGTTGPCRICTAADPQHSLALWIIVQ